MTQHRARPHPRPRTRPQSQSSFRPQVLELEDRRTPAVAFALSNASLIRFDTANPGAALAPLAITGVTPGETIVDIDFRPQNGQLYGLGVNAGTDTATLYSISTVNGTATAVGTPGAIAFVSATTGTPIDLPDPTAVGYGIDFNPTVDRVRVVAGSLNFRVNPSNGAAVDGNATAAGINPDGSINGPTTTVDATAYTNNSPNVAVTTQYTIDGATNSLYIQNPPNNGTQTVPLLLTLNGTTLDFTRAVGFDIDSSVVVTQGNAPAVGQGFTVLNIGGQSVFYTVNLATGALGSPFAFTNPIQGLAVQTTQPAVAPTGFPAIALSADGTSLLRFNTAAPTLVTGPITITGVATTDRLVGIDFRPATGQFYALGVNATSGLGTLYLIDPQGGQATVVGTAGSVTFVDATGTTILLPDPATTGYGFDFNPTVDRIRVTTSTGLNFRINPNNGAPVDGSATAAGINPDGSINGLPTGSTGVSATAYTNSFGQPLTGGVTTQYTLDATSNSLFIQNPPNNGTQNLVAQITLNGVPLDFTDISGFDIPSGVRVTTSGTPAAGIGYAVLTVNNVAGLYSIDLTTGAATSLGPVGTGPTGLAGFALAEMPAGTIQFGAPTFTATEEGGAATVTLTRTGGSSGVVSVTLNVTGGSATAGTDFTAPPMTVTFADGQTSVTVTIPLLDDMLNEGPETVNLSLSVPTGGAVLGATTSATVTVNDADAPGGGPGGGGPGGGGPGGGGPGGGGPGGGGATNLTAVGGGFGAAATIQVFNPDGSTRFTLTAFVGFLGGVNVRTGDVTGDGIDDILATPASTANAHLMIFSGADGTMIFSAILSATPATGGLTATLVGSQIVLSAGPGGPATLLILGTNFQVSATVTAFVNFNGGIDAVAFDSATNQIVLRAINSVNGPHIKRFGFDGTELASFFGSDPAFLGA
jgi:hypothetical protein